MFDKDLKDFEQMTRPDPFRVFKVIGYRMRMLDFPCWFYKLTTKLGVIKEFSYRDTIYVPVQIDAFFGKSYVNTYQVLATVYFNVEEVHEVYQHFFYIGQRITGLKEKGSVRVIGREVNEDVRVVKVTGHLKDIKVRLGNGGYQDIDRCAAKTSIVLDTISTMKDSPFSTNNPTVKKTGRFDFSPLKNLHMEKIIPCAIGAVDDEEMKVVFLNMRESMEQSLKAFNINDCIVVDKGVLEA